MNKVTLFLMTQKGLNVLEGIVSSGMSEVVETIVLGRDRNVVKDFSEDIVRLAKEAGIPLVERTESYAIRTPYSIAVSWRWLIETEDRTSRLITLHESLLPAYRGFAPLVNQLIHKEPVLGVSAIFSNVEFDRGEIIFQSETPITYPCKIQSAIEIVSMLYVKVMGQLLAAIRTGKALESRPQSEEGVSYSLWRDEEDYRIDWSQDSARVQRFIDAVGYPYAGALTYLGDRAVRIIDAEIEEDVKIMNRDLGKLIFSDEGFPVIVCGSGLLKITKAIYDEDEESIFPLKRFRLRFK